MKTFAGLSLLICTCFLVAGRSALAASDCVRTASEAGENHDIREFVKRLGGGDFEAGKARLQGQWKYLFKQVQFRINNDVLEGKVDHSAWAPLQICSSTLDPMHLQITVFHQLKKPTDRYTVVNVETQKDGAKLGIRLADNEAASFSETHRKYYGFSRSENQIAVANSESLPRVAPMQTASIRSAVR